MKLTYRGTGITEEERQSLDMSDQADVLEFIVFLLENKDPLNSFIERQVSKSEKTLSFAGLPHRPDLRYVRENGKWKRSDRGLGLFAVMSEGQILWDSPEGFAIRKLVECYELRKALETGDLKKIVASSIEFGRLVEQDRLKQKWDKAAASGKKASDGGKKGWTIAYGGQSEEHCRWLEMFHKFRATGMSKTEAYVSIAKQAGVHKKSVSRAINKLIRNTPPSVP